MSKAVVSSPLSEMGPWRVGAVGSRQEETLCSREDAHYKIEVPLPSNLQSGNPQTTEPEVENVIGRSCTCCIAAFVVLFSHEDEKKNSLL